MGGLYVCDAGGREGRGGEAQEASEFFSSNHVSCEAKSQSVTAASARLVIRMPCDCLAKPARFGQLVLASDLGAWEEHKEEGLLQ